MTALALALICFVLEDVLLLLSCLQSSFAALATA